MAKFKDISGQKYGTLTAVKFLRQQNKATFWLFKCDCGNEKEANKSTIISKSDSTCGYKCEFRPLHKNLKDITELRSGSVVAVRRTRRKPNQRVWLWECVCDCGKTFEAPVNQITRKHTTSCGCKINYSGERHPNYKGGNQINANGYKLILVSEHPFAQKSGYIQEHRLVMEQKLGRYLLPNENVHHRNTIRSDNRIENLELWVKSQPVGARAEDLVSFAREILKTYGDLFPE